MFETIRKGMPGITTQAQFNATLAAFDALKVTLNAIFLADTSEESRGQAALKEALEVARQVTVVVVKLSHVPEAATSQAAEEFKNPPAQFTEYDTMKALLLELETISTSEGLAQWYSTNRPRIDRVVSQSYRNELLDTIRSKKISIGRVS
jgi:hypothetical protein